MLQQSRKGGHSACRAAPQGVVGLCLESSLLPAPILHSSVCWVLVWGFPCRLPWFFTGGCEQQASSLFCKPGPAIKVHHCWDWEQSAGGKAAGVAKVLVRFPCGLVMATSCWPKSAVRPCCDISAQMLVAGRCDHLQQFSVTLPLCGGTGAVPHCTGDLTQVEESNMVVERRDPRAWGRGHYRGVAFPS